MEEFIKKLQNRFGIIESFEEAVEEVYEKAHGCCTCGYSGYSTYEIIDIVKNEIIDNEIPDTGFIEIPCNNPCDDTHDHKGCEIDIHDIEKIMRCNK